MPGLIVDVLHSVGDMVKKGENMIILEAMKMENIIKAPHDARIKSIHINKNQSVDKDQILLEFE
ncbi:MAG: acetyl-CoA carboxylase biotin carboxyl carrier protein subunit [Calditrichaeota bacterium]|nr:MAG: acetyl-CoA carboxylase biotin carboxyl carrier protein subunit [Calditrichota bacterium]